MQSPWNRLAEVIKKDGEVKLTAKAFNGRCILEWVAKVSREAAPQYPGVERLQLQAVCMTLVFNINMLVGCVFAQEARHVRTSLARFLTLAESSPRFLPSGCICVLTDHPRSSKRAALMNEEGMRYARTRLVLTELSQRSGRGFLYELSEIRMWGHSCQDRQEPMGDAPQDPRH